MTVPQDWDRLDRLFDAALDLPVDQRTAYLEHACGDDPALRTRLKKLLAYAETRGGLASGGAWAGPLGADVADSVARQHEHTLSPGSSVGPYRVVRAIASGGMGSVYLAARADGSFEQQVAIKVIRHPDRARNVIERFGRERQILASLEHPAIARLLNGGATEDGFPYLAMEFVDGETIDCYCDRHCLAVDARLVLFRQAAEAVSFAHRNLIVHRDLKPSNLLVDADGHAKLLDFGIAQVLGAESVGAADDARLMTPAYASPEQIRGDPVTTASDVYQLGVLLYVLLSGRRPYPTEGYAEAADAICYHQPLPPSVAASQAPTFDAKASPDTVAMDRGTTRSALRRRLAGDLDRIVLTALHKSPEHRYRSVHALIDDLDRCREGLPIRARSQTVFYRLRKWAWRHRTAVVVAATSLVLIVVLSGLYAYRLSRALTRETAEAARAQAASAFLSGIFGELAPTRAQGARLRDLAVLERSVARIEADPTGSPALQAELLTQIGSVYRELAHYDHALPVLERAEGMRRALGSEGSLPLAATLHELGLVHTEVADFAAAGQAFDEALALRRAELSESHPDTARSLVGLARTEIALSAFEEGRERLVGAIDALTASLGSEHPDVGLALRALAAAEAAQRRTENALETLSESRRILERHFGPEHPHVLLAIAETARLAYEQGEYGRAQAQYERVIPKLRDAFGERHPTVGNALMGLGRVFHGSRRHARALATFEQVLSLRESVFGNDHPATAEALRSIALSSLRLGDTGRALIHFERALAILERSVGRRHEDVAVVLISYGDTLRAEQQAASAVDHYRRAASILAEVQGEDHPIVSQPLSKLGQVLMELDRADEAEAPLRRALALVADHEHASVMTGTSLARCLVRLGRLDEAQVLLDQGERVAPDAGVVREGIMSVRVELEQRRNAAPATAPHSPQ